jgi:hypothetical protein
MYLLSQEFDPARHKRGADGFAAYACRILDRRCVDWSRKRFVDGRYATPDRIAIAHAVSLDAALTDDEGEHHNSVGAAVAARESDGATDFGPAGAFELLQDRARKRDENLRLIRDEFARRAQERADRVRRRAA